MDSCQFERREDGAYIIYTPPGGADPVTKKLGEPEITILGTYRFDGFSGIISKTINIADVYDHYEKLTDKNFIVPNVSSSYGYNNAASGVGGGSNFYDFSYDPATGILTVRFKLSGKDSGTGTRWNYVDVPVYMIV